MVSVSARLPGMEHTTIPDSAAAPSRTVWVGPDDVDGPLTAGRTVRALRPLDDFCLRRDDGGRPVPRSAALLITELRPGAAMAEELPQAAPETHVYEVHYRNADRFNHWQRVRAGSAALAICLARERRRMPGVGFVLLGVEKVTD